MNFEMPTFKEEVRPDNKSIIGYSKKNGIEIVEMDVPDNDTYIVYQAPTYLPHDFIKKIINLYASQYQYKKIVDTGEFIGILEQNS